MAKRKKKERSRHVISDAQFDKLLEHCFNNGVMFERRSSSWGNRKKLAEELLADAGLPKEAVRAVQSLVDNEELSAVTSPLRKAMNWARDACIMSFGPSVGFLHADQVEQAEQKMQSYRQQALEALEDYLPKYPEEKRKFQEAYPNLYHESYYPTAEQLKEKFNLRWRFYPVMPPSADGQKVKVSKAMSAEMQEREQRKYRQMMKEEFQQNITAIRSVFLTIIRELHGILKDSNKRLVESRVEKPKQFLERFFSNMNLLGDEPFADLCKEAKDLFDGVFAEDVRDDDEYRKAMAEATELVAKAVEELPTVEIERDLTLGDF